MRQSEIQMESKKILLMAKPRIYIDPQERKMHIEAHRGTFSRQGSLYDLGKIRVALTREFYQASCGIERFLGKEAGRFSLIFKNSSRRSYACSKEVRYGCQTREGDN